MKTEFITKRKLALLILIVLGMFVAYYLMFLQVAGANRQNQMLAGEINKYIQKERERRELQRTANEIQPFMEKIQSYFVGKDEGVVRFIETVELLGANHKLKMSIDSVAIEFLDESVLGVELLNLRFKTLGSWNDTFYFISALESLPYKIIIRNANVSLASLGEKGKLPVWKGSFEMVVNKLK